MKRRTLYLVLSALVVTAARVSGTEFDRPPDQSFLWNRFSSVLVQDSFAVAGVGNGLLVMQWDGVRHTYEPVASLYLSTEPGDYKRYGDTAIYRGANDILYLVSLAELPDLRLLQRGAPPTAYYDFAVRGNYAYLAVGFQGVRRYAFTNTSDMTFVDSTMLPVHAVQVEIVDSQLFVLDDYNGIAKFSLGPGRFGRFDGYLYVPLEPFGFAVADRAAIVSLWQRAGVMIGDLSPGNTYAETHVSALGEVRRIFVRDSLAVMLSKNLNLIEYLDLRDTNATGSLYESLPDRDYRGDFVDHGDGLRLLLPEAAGGLVELSVDPLRPIAEESRPYTRTGPITSLAVVDGKLATAGIRNPLEIYTISRGNPPALDTTLLGALGNVRWLHGVGNRLLAYVTPLQQIIDFRFFQDSITSQPLLAIDSTLAMEFRWRTRIGSEPEGILTWNGPQGHLFSIPDSTHAGTHTRVGVPGGIKDAVFVDSLLVVGTSKRQLMVYRVYEDYEVEFRGMISLPAPVTHMVPLRRFCPLGVYVFCGLSALKIDLSDPTAPAVDEMYSLTNDVQASVRWPEAWPRRSRLFTIGNSGINEFLWRGSCPWPETVSNGGPAGHLITLIGDILAVSDGGAVHLYELDTATVPVSSEATGEPAAAIALRNYPNPFNPSTTIEYEIPEDGLVRLNVFNLLGRRVTTLVQGWQTAGRHQVDWTALSPRGQPLASGVYFYRLEFNGRTVTRKMVLLR